MEVIHLSEVDSTNQYMKELISSNILDDFTVVTTNHQTQGKGQQGSIWIDEKGKNLLCSFYVHSLQNFNPRAFYLTMATSWAVSRLIQHYTQHNVEIKWPNDILINSKKISGILIESKITKEHFKYAIIGIGININQTEFPKTIKAQCTSFKKVTGDNFLVNDVLKYLHKELKTQLSNVSKSQLKQNYYSVLYGYQKKLVFLDTKKQIRFTGKIISVTEEGKLCIEKEDGNKECFGMKEIQFELSENSVTK